MARSRARSGGSGRRGASAKREPKARSKKKAPVAAAEVEVVEEGKGLGIDEGVILVTTILFLAAILFTDYILGGYGEGLFFKR